MYCKNRYGFPFCVNCQRFVDELVNFTAMKENSNGKRMTPIEKLIAEDFGHIGTPERGIIQLSTLVKLFQDLGRQICVRII